MKTDDTGVHVGSPNVFADLGVRDAETHHLKAQIVASLYRLATEQKLTQAQTGAVMGITQPEVSRLFRGTFREYSVDRLLGFLAAFHHDVEIVARPTASGERGRITFGHVAAK